MSGNVKKSPEKILSVDDIIKKLLKASELKIEEFAVETGISLDALRKSIARNILSDGSVEKILDTFIVNEGFLKGEEKELNYQGKRTSVQKPAAVAEKASESPEEIYRKIVEGGTEYLLIPKTALEGHYRLVAIEQLTLQEKELERRNDELIRKDTQIMGLYELFKLMASGTPLPSPEVEKTQEKTGVRNSGS